MPTPTPVRAFSSTVARERRGQWVLSAARTHVAMAVPWASSTPQVARAATWGTEYHQRQRVLSIVVLCMKARERPVSLCGWHPVTFQLARVTTAVTSRARRLQAPEGPKRDAW